MEQTLSPIVATTKVDFYQQLAAQLESLLSRENDLVSNLSQMCALLFHHLADVNWVGFYRYVNDVLLAGPFQGQVACSRIVLGEGVCGAAALRCETINVPNVHEFVGHIACDSVSNSEIVVPVVAGLHLVGVLDIDSPKLNRFDRDDVAGLEKLVQILLATIAN